MLCSKRNPSAEKMILRSGDIVLSTLKHLLNKFYLIDIFIYMYNPLTINKKNDHIKLNSASNTILIIFTICTIYLGN